jgi:hypothetical protein
MKRLFSTASKIAVLAGIIVTAAGCGSSSNNGTTVGGVAGMAGTTITFSAPTALMTSSGRIQAGVFPTTIADFFNTRIPISGGAGAYGISSCPSAYYAPYNPGYCATGAYGAQTWTPYYAWAFMPVDPLSSGQVVLNSGVGVGAGAQHFNIRSNLVRSTSGYAMLDLYATPTYGAVGQVALSGTLSVPVEFASDKGFASGVTQIMIDLFPSGSYPGAFNGGVAVLLANGQTALVEFDPVTTPY